jgi:two-component system OmpR family response regulator
MMLETTISPAPLRPDDGESARILLVEDDPFIANMLEELLTEAGFSVCAATSGSTMDVALTQETIDLILLDVMLPQEDGFSICRRLRASSNVPIIMVTALGEDVDRVGGLEIGADDYITKPFNSRELIARVRALMRRVGAANSSHKHRLRPFRFAQWSIYPSERLLYSPDRARVTMTSAEFDLLLAFCQNPGRVLSREQLLELTHGGLAGPIERSVDVHVSRIRQKIEPDPRDPTFIKTVRLGGYVFTPQVEVGS